jgi:hypothetical protein
LYVFGPSSWPFVLRRSLRTSDEGVFLMHLGTVVKGWKLLYVARVAVAEPALNLNRLTLKEFLKTKDPDGKTEIRYTSYPRLHHGPSFYCTPAGVAKDASGVEIKERT